MNIEGPSGILHRGTAGEDFNLTCNVTVEEYLIVKPTVKWLIRNQGSVDSGNSVVVGNTTHSGVMSTKTLTFSPLCTSHQKTYSCKAIINIPSIDLMRTSSEEKIIHIQNPCK